MIVIMARKNYSTEFRQQAVDLYETTPDATLKQFATDLGVSRGTPRGVGQGLGQWRQDHRDAAVAPGIRWGVRGCADRPARG